MLSKHISLISIAREFRSNDLPMKLLLGFRNPQIKIGGPRRIRTPDPLIRSQVLYPAELSVHCAGK